MSVAGLNCAYQQTLEGYGYSIDATCDVQGYDHTALARIFTTWGVACGYIALKCIARLDNPLANQNQ